MNDYRLNWNPPAEPLGAAIRPGPAMTAAQRLRDERMEFEIMSFDVALHKGDCVPVDPADCRQIKGLTNPPAKSSFAPPQGWVPSRERKPPAVGDYRCIDNSSGGEWTRRWNGSAWSHATCQPGTENGERYLCMISPEPPEISWFEPLTTSPSNAGWIEHDGNSGAPELKEGQTVMLRYRDGSVLKGGEHPAAWIGWRRRHDGNDILAYLIQD